MSSLLACWQQEQYDGEETTNLKKARSAMKVRREQLVKAIVDVTDCKEDVERSHGQIFDKREFESKLAVARSTCSNFKCQLLSLQRDFDKNFTELELLRRRVHRAEAALLEAQKKSEPENIESKTEKVSIDNKTDKVESTDKELTHLREDVLRLETQLQASTDECARLAAERRAAETTASASFNIGKDFVPLIKLDESKYQLAGAEKEIDRLAHLVEGLRRDKQELVNVDHENLILRRELDSLRSQYGSLDKECRHCQEEVTKVIQERDAARLYAVSDADKQKREIASSSMKECKEMISTLKKAVDTMKAQLKRTDAIRSEAMAIRDENSMKCTEAEKSTIIMKAMLTEYESIIIEERKMKIELQRELRQIRSIAQVLDALAPVTEIEKRDLEAFEEAKRADLNSKLEVAAKEKIDAKEKLIETDSTVILLKNEIQNIRSQLSARESELSAFAQEMEEVTGAYEDMLTQNTRQLETLESKDLLHNSLVADKTNADHEKERALQKASMSDKRCLTLEESLHAERGLLAGFRNKNEELLKCISASNEEIMKRDTECDRMMMREKELEGKFSILEMKVQKANLKEVEAKERESVAIGEVTKERLKRQRLEEDVKVLKVRLGGGVAAEEAEDSELKFYKRMVTCNICNKNIKDTIITRCFHMFCRSCVDKNLETRLRKCPGCGVAFGQNDVTGAFL